MINTADSSSLIDAVKKELERNRELLQLYKTIPSGVFGAMMIDKDIQEAEKALEDQDAVALIKVLVKLRNNE